MVVAKSDRESNRTVVLWLTIAVAVAFAVTWVLQRGDGSTEPAAAGPAESQEAGPGAAAAPSGGSASLDAVYELCVRAAGLDPGGVQVLIWSADSPTPPGAVNPQIGRPYWVKTGNQVPAGVHRPCLMGIGGADPHASSYGF